MPLKISNTLTGKKEPFSPLTPGKVGMYVCGVTLYDKSHIGHARSLIVFDVIVRYLRFSNYQVNYVRNLTDLDDKIIQKALAEGVSSEEIAERYLGEFQQDVQSLGCLLPDHEPRATAHIPRMIDLIQALEQKGLAYQTGGDVFFCVEGFPGYGKLSKRRLEEMVAGSRVEIDERKRHPMDFALWKSAKPGEPAWQSPWGNGRPGWHIECSVMSSHHLGQPFDIHGGGMDLIFPHHENEIAQSEGANGKELARFWIHNGFVNVQQEKMSKSLGNMVMIRESLSWAHPESLRLFFLASHYRSPIDYFPRALEDTTKSLVRIYEALARMEAVGGASDPDPSFLREFAQAMDDDFNTPKAIGLIFDQIRMANRFLDSGKRETIPALREGLRTVGPALGILTRNPDEFLSQLRSLKPLPSAISEEEIRERIREREQARAGRDWAAADVIRDELAARGVSLEDGPERTHWRWKRR